MNLNNVSFNTKTQFYINNMRPVFNKRALFADMTGDYVIPPTPKPYSIVKFLFRTFKNNVDQVYFERGEESLLMEKSFRKGDFDYYEIDVPIENEEIFYHFKIISGRIRFYYDMRGAVGDISEDYKFHLIPGFDTPKWAKGACIYQIYVDRFYNGDPSNDVLDHEYAYIGDHSSHVTDWYKYPAHMGVREFYGGDLKGVMDKLDYLEDLGIEAIYFNPLFVSPSNHKYDIQDYDHIDPHIGVILEDEGELLNPGDMENLHASRYIKRVTSLKNLEASNKLFAQLVEECHRRNIKVIIDGVFNHCGSFNKWMDRERIYEGQEEYEAGAYVSEDSPYNSFFNFNASQWPYNHCYDSWWGNDTLPKLNYEASPKLEQYILDIAKKWVSPPYNVDGWRLDVAADLGHSPEYNHSFWKKFRKVVKEANPNAIIIAEHYGCAREWLKGEEWDTVMNYDAFMEPLTWFLTGMQKHSDDYRHDLLGNADNFWNTMKHHAHFFAMPSLQVSMNELSNHDHSRFLTRTNHKVGRVSSLGSEAADQGVNKAVMRNAVLMQFSWIGAPTIYYGDEAGLCGFTDPDNRRSYPWGREDTALIDFHKQMIKIRKAHDELKIGSTKLLNTDYGFVAYGRFNAKKRCIVLVNNHEHGRDVDVAVWMAEVPSYAVLTRLICTDNNGYNTEKVEYEVNGGHLRLHLEGCSSMVLYHEDEENLK